jgi:hypothetical protein
MDLFVVCCKSSSFVERNVGEEKVLVPLSDDVVNMNKVFTLNGVGAFIYDQVDGKRSVYNICDILMAEYDVDKAVALKDVEHFFCEALEKGVLFIKS